MTMDAITELIISHILHHILESKDRKTTVTHTTCSLTSVVSKTDGFGVMPGLNFE